VLSAAYGAGTQYLGARIYPWGPEVAQLSAPWLAIAFFGGWTQKDARRGVLVGLACTVAALVGYWLMTDSPVEGSQYTLGLARAFFISNYRVVIGALATGPLFGWLGQQWKTHRSLTGPLLLAAAFCLEPLARQVTIEPFSQARVIVGEVAVGLLLAAAVLVRRYRQNA
jgi:hypothetical protein